VTRRWEAFIAWLADIFRFAHALIYWNWRKQFYRLGGCRGPAPCQNESDEAKLGLVRCDVVMQWNQPGRFRPLCPLLVHTPEGWRCSVPAKSVRPFWMRASAIGLGSVAALWLALTFSVFAFFRWGNDLEIRWVDIGWPGHWSRVRTAQSERLFHRSMAALRQGNLDEAYLALTSARQRDPRNYRANLLVGQITMFQGSYLFADEIFAQLRRDTPEEAYRTAVVYHDTLLMLLRYGRLARHCFEMARADPDRASLWFRSLLFALRGGRLAADFVRDHSAELGSLSPHARLLIEAEAEIALGRDDRALELLRPPYSGPLNPVYMELQVARLAELGETVAAQVLLDFYGPLLGEFRHARAQFALDLRSGDRTAAEASFRQLLTFTTDSVRAQLVALELILHPDEGFYRDLHAHCSRDSVLRRAVDGPTLWAAGLACGAPVEAAWWQHNGQQPAGEIYPRISAIDFESRSFAAVDSVASVVNVLTFPRDTVIALLTKLPANVPPPLPPRPPGPSRR
jgi:tetratricopeptide (TPR) repeat protein